MGVSDLYSKRSKYQFFVGGYWEFAIDISRSASFVKNIEREVNRDSDEPQDGCEDGY